MLLTPQQTSNLYAHATTNGYAILAVNADSPAALTDCLIAAKECDAPIIIETSLWQLTGHSFGAGDPLLGIDRYLANLKVLANSERFRSVPVVYHTDHIKGPETLTILKHAMRVGISSISLDSSELSAAENIETMNELCRYANEHELPAVLEMEAGVDDGVTSLDETRSLFGEVERQHHGYLSLWAPGVGTKHGLGNDMAGFSTSAVADHQALASEIADRPIGIALHGSSGLSNEQLSTAVTAGVTKVNWSSESLLIRSQAAQGFFASNNDRLKKSHSDFKNTAMDNGLQEAVSQAYVPRLTEQIRVLNGEGMASAFLTTDGH